MLKIYIRVDTKGMKVLLLETFRMFKIYIRVDTKGMKGIYECHLAWVPKSIGMGAYSWGPILRVLSMAFSGHTLAIL